MTTVNIDGVSREMTAEEQAEYDAQQLAWETTGKKNLKLKSIREIRNQKLSETDYLAMSDNTMPDNIKTWRQSLRDLPQNNTTEEQYDALLATDSDGNLTNSIWSKP
tara:strand:+ start:648 stop:968 length:321 start_codon:yes stop_codon:yes gene_type:complete